MQFLVIVFGILDYSPIHLFPLWAARRIQDGGDCAVASAYFLSNNVSLE